MSYFLSQLSSIPRIHTLPSVWSPTQWATFSCRPDETAETPGSLTPEGSTCAVFKVRTIYVKAPKGRNIETDGPAACNPKFDNFGS